VIVGDISGTGSDIVFPSGVALLLPGKDVDPLIP